MGMRILLARNLLAIVAVASAASASLPAAAHTMWGIRIGAPLYPPPPVVVYEQAPVAPVWTPGHWEWQGDGHVWVPGYFSYPQRQRPPTYRY